MMGIGHPVKVFTYWNTVRNQMSRGMQEPTSFYNQPLLMTIFTTAPIIPPTVTDSLDFYTPTMEFPLDWNLDQKRKALSHHKYVWLTPKIKSSILTLLYDLCYGGPMNLQIYWLYSRKRITITFHTSWSKTLDAKKF